MQVEQTDYLQECSYKMTHLEVRTEKVYDAKGKHIYTTTVKANLVEIKEALNNKDAGTPEQEFIKNMGYSAEEADKILKHL